MSKSIIVFRIVIKKLSLVLYTLVWLIIGFFVTPSLLSLHGNSPLTQPAIHLSIVGFWIAILMVCIIPYTGPNIVEKDVQK